MSLKRISILFSIFSISFLLAGSIKLIDTYDLLREGLIEKKNFFKGVRAASIDVMDDFRGEKFGGLNFYREKNTQNSLFYSENRLLENEQNILKANLKMNFEKEKANVLLRRANLDRRGLRTFRTAQSRIKERLYFYGFRGFYHKEKMCMGRLNEKIFIFSTMEEAARQGFFPCKYCILKSEG